MADSTMDIEFSFANDTAAPPSRPPPLLSASDILRPNMAAAPAPLPARSLAPQQQPTRPTAAAPAAAKQQPSDNVDYSFLDGLANKRKTKNNRNKPSNFLGAHGDLDLFVSPCARTNARPNPPPQIRGELGTGRGCEP